jgi:hypothetical protein
MKRRTKRIVRDGGLLAALLGAVTFMTLAAEESPDGTKFLGAVRCKNCHQSSKDGNQFSTWQKMAHAGAYAILGKEQAREIARKQGIDDPRKSDACLRCHVTAFGMPDSRLGMRFDPAMGVQCESCHGPGLKHFKARLAAAGKDDVYDITEQPYVKIPPGEIDIEPAFSTCLKCHNAESPTFRPICIEKIVREILHFFRRSPTPEEIAALKKKIAEEMGAKNVSCGGPEKCETCRKAAKP